MNFYDPTDFEWGVMARLLPNKPQGVLTADDRRVLNGIFWVQRSGVPCVTCRSDTDPGRPAATA